MTLLSLHVPMRKAVAFLASGSLLAASLLCAAEGLEARSHSSSSNHSSSSSFFPDVGPTGPTGPVGPTFFGASTSRYSTVSGTSYGTTANIPFEATFVDDNGFSYNEGALTALVAGRYEITIGVCDGNPPNTINLYLTRAGVETQVTQFLSTSTSFPIITITLDLDLLVGDIISARVDSGAINVNLDASGARSTILNINRISD